MSAFAVKLGLLINLKFIILLLLKKDSKRELNNWGIY